VRWGPGVARRPGVWFAEQLLVGRPFGVDG